MTKISKPRRKTRAKKNTGEGLVNRVERFGRKQNNYRGGVESVMKKNIGGKGSREEGTLQRKDESDPAKMNLRGFAKGDALTRGSWIFSQTSVTKDRSEKLMESRRKDAWLVFDG